MKKWPGGRTLPSAQLPANERLSIASRHPPCIPPRLNMGAKSGECLVSSSHRGMQGLSPYHAIRTINTQRESGKTGTGFPSETGSSLQLLTWSGSRLRRRQAKVCLVRLNEKHISKGYTWPSSDTIEPTVFRSAATIRSFRLFKPALESLPCHP